jgi:antitoxin component YwqK of YwqJK toxin-antitoxin module
MKRIFKQSVAFFIGALVLVSSSVEAQNVIDNNGKKQGVWSKSYPNGKVKYKGEFKDDKEIGKFLYYSKDGKLSQIIEYSENSDLSKAKFLYKDGKVMSEGMYKNKKKEGAWSYYNEKGKKIQEEFFVAGIKNGKETNWDRNGKVTNTTMYKDGVKEGEFYQNLYADGYYICNYSKDKRNGAFTFYFASSKKQCEGQYVNDKKVGEWIYTNENGDVIKIQKWENDKLVYDAIKIRTRSGELDIEFKDIAYFYPLGKQTCVVLKNGKRMNAFNQYEQIVNLSDGNTFLLLNKVNKVYANYSAIKGTKDDGGKELLIMLEPKADVDIRTDEDSRKALKSLFAK